MSPILYSEGKINTIYDVFCERVRQTPQALAYRHYVPEEDAWLDITWQSMAERVESRAQTLKVFGAKAGNRCAILLGNSPGWVCADQAVLSLNMVTVPLFYNDRAENIAHVLFHSSARFLIVNTREQWRALEHDLYQSSLEKVILADSFEVIWSNEKQQRAQDTVEIPDNLATIIYTSGTTGKPKGVMLSHANILTNAAAANAVSNIYPEDLFLSFLPLSHAFERTVGYYLPMMTGASVAFSRSVLTLQEDLQTIKPTVIVCVPRVFEKINERFNEKLSNASTVMKKLVTLAEGVGYQHFQRNQKQLGWGLSELAFPLLDHLVGNKIRASLGGRLRIAVSGGAPLSPSIAKRYLGFGVPIIQGYGLTECSPVVSSNSLENNDPESVGETLEHTEVSIDAESGELLVRGPTIMLGYWLQPEETAEVIDTDAWFHTGDIAKITNKRIYITGRIKDILVLSNGEKVPPTDVEDAILQDPWVDQVMVVGEGKPFLVALIVASAQGQGADKADLIKRIASDMHAFPGYEKIKDIVLCSEPWTIEEGLLTPTMKLRRQQIVQKYETKIKKIYDA